MQYLYNAVNFLTNIHKRHPIAHPIWRGTGCNLWIQPLINIVPQVWQLSMQYLIILDHIIMAFDCTFGYSIKSFGLFYRIIFIIPVAKNLCGASTTLTSASPSPKPLLAIETLEQFQYNFANQEALRPYHWQ